MIITRFKFTHRRGPLFMSFYIFHPFNDHYLPPFLFSIFFICLPFAAFSCSLMSNVLTHFLTTNPLKSNPSSMFLLHSIGVEKRCRNEVNNFCTHWSPFYFYFLIYTSKVRKYSQIGKRTKKLPGYVGQHK